MTLPVFAVRSTPLRLTLLLLLLFVLSSIATFAAAYIVIRTSYDAALKTEITQAIETYRTVPEDDELLERLSQDMASTRPAYRVLQYLPDNGPRISNVERIEPVSGFTILPASAIAPGKATLAESYLAQSARVGAGQLIVAETRETVIEMGKVFVAMLLIGLLPTIVIATIAGLIVARGARNRIDTIQGVLHDMTLGRLAVRVPDMNGREDDLSRMGHAVNQMASAQEALIASMRQVSSDIAHDLKTPIQRVGVILDQLRHKTALSAGQEALLTRAEAETDGIVKTFQALLQLAQIEGGAVRDRFVATDVADVATDVVDLFTPDAEEQGYRLDLALGVSGPLNVLGDRHLLAQVLANLIGNAMRHTPTGRAIKVGVTRLQGHVVLSVSDDGPGIPEAERDKVLQRLYRLEHSRTTEGNGLGLSLVSAICDLHGATLTLEDAMPGLRVRIVFPAA